MREHILNYKRVMHVTRNNMGHSPRGTASRLGLLEYGGGVGDRDKMPFDEI